MRRQQSTDFVDKGLSRTYGQHFLWVEERGERADAVRMMLTTNRPRDRCNTFYTSALETTTLSKATYEVHGAMISGSRLFGVQLSSDGEAMNKIRTRPRNQHVDASLKCVYRSDLWSGGFAKHLNGGTSDEDSSDRPA